MFLLPLGITIDSLNDLDVKLSPGAIWTSRVAAAGLPLLVIAYAVWLTNAPDDLRQLPPIRYAALGGFAVLALAGAVVSVQQLALWNRVSAAEKDAERAEDSTQEDAAWRAFEALTDADPLLKWYEFTTYGMPEDIRKEAMRQIATRSDLDAELVEVLQSDNPNWAGEGVRFVAELAISPSSALAEAVQRRLDAYAKFLIDDSTVVTYDGDRRLDYLEAVRFREALKAARRLAETNNADLRSQIEALRGAVAFYPKSDLAVRYPAEVEETQRQIKETLVPAK